MSILDFCNFNMPLTMLLHIVVFSGYHPIIIKPPWKKIHWTTLKFDFAFFMNIFFLSLDAPFCAWLYMEITMIILCLFFPFQNVGWDWPMLDMVCLALTMRGMEGPVAPGVTSETLATLLQIATASSNQYVVWFLYIYRERNQRPL